MSGAEAVLVLSLLANIVGVVDFTCKALARIKDAKESVNELPKAFKDVDLVLPLLGDALNRTRTQVEAGSLNEETCKAVRPVLEDCLSKINTLKLIFDECVPKDDSSRFTREWKAFSSLRYDKKVEELLKLIWRHIPLLTYHHVTSPVPDTIDPLATTLASMSLINQQKPTKYSFLPVQW